jgi:hypothetical protein
LGFTTFLQYFLYEAKQYRQYEVQLVHTVHLVTRKLPQFVPSCNVQISTEAFLVMAESSAFKLDEIPLIETFTENPTTDDSQHDLIPPAFLPEAQKKKRQRKADAPQADASLDPSVSSGFTADDVPVFRPPAEDEGIGSSTIYSDLPESITLLAGADQLPGLDALAGGRIRAPKVRPEYETEYNAAGVVLSKAATRMRKYRADHRHDASWLAKEAERMRNMRAARKAGTSGSKEDKPRRQKVIRKKREKNASLSDLPPVEKFNHEEYLRKEAERVRRYRALKQLDPEWKKNDSDRMRLYRAKRKLDASLKMAGTPLPKIELDLLDGTIENEMPTQMEIDPSMPQHHLIEVAPSKEIKPEDTDSEDEAQV